MAIRKTGILLLGVCLALFSLVSVASDNHKDNPVSMLQYVADNMVDQLRANQANLKTKPAVVYDLAYKYVVPHADLAEMSKRVVPPQTWNSATPAERSQFEKQFTRLVIRTYASALSSYKDQKVRIFPVRGNVQQSKNIEVSSEITSPDAQPIRVSYRLLRGANGWKLYDMSVEGVSLIESFRSQFSDILAKGNMSALLKRMSEHNDR